MNQYRPHQSRESLILMMEEQVAKANAETEGIYAMKRKVDGILDGFKDIHIPEDESVEEVVAVGEVDDGSDAWEELTRLYG